MFAIHFTVKFNLGSFLLTPVNHNTAVQLFTIWLKSQPKNHANNLSNNWVLAFETNGAFYRPINSKQKKFRSHETQQVSFIGFDDGKACARRIADNVIELTIIPSYKL